MQELQQLKQAFAVGVQVAEVTGSTKALGQNMREDQAEERNRRECSSLELAAFAVAILKCNLAVVESQDVLLPDHATVEVAAQK